MGVNSKEWFKGDWSVMKNFEMLKNKIDYVQTKSFTKRYGLLKKNNNFYQNKFW